MKLVYCLKCHTIVELKKKVISFCMCEECCGRYLNDNITVVVTKPSIVVGIDNNSFTVALARYEMHKPGGESPFDQRVDFFFVGWIPTIPGEVVKVNSLDEVKDFDSTYSLSSNGYGTLPVPEEELK